MKLYKSFLFTTLVAGATLVVSCNDEGYWDVYTPANGVTEYSFAQSANSYSYLPTDEIPSSYELKVYRSNANGEKALPIIVNYAGSTLTVTDTVVFANGSNEATCTISVNEPAIGATESMILMIDTLAQVSPSGNATLTFTFSLDYTWVPAGSCMMTSNWAGTDAKINIEKAQEYEGNLYRLVSPYYILEQDYCPNPGYHVQFELDENYEPLTLPRFQNVGEPSSKGGWWTLYYSASAEYCSFTREGTVYTINGAWAYGDASMGYNLYDYATESFDWNEGCPLAK